MFDEPTKSSGNMAGALGASSSLTPGNDSLFSANYSGGAKLPASPVAPEAPPMFGANTTVGKKPGKKPSGSFMGTAGFAPTNDQTGLKTLLGQ